MSNYDFTDLMTIDSLQWGREIDPIGLLTYQNYKRKKQFCEATEEVEQLDEVLNLQQRMRRKLIMRRLAPRLARARKIAMKRHAGNDVLKRRAKSLARKTMARKLLGGRNKADVSPSERARVEKILAKRKMGIERLATRLVPVVRKKQAMRFAAKKTPKKTPSSAPAKKPTPTSAPAKKPTSTTPPKKPVAPTAPTAPKSA